MDLSTGFCEYAMEKLDTKAWKISGYVVLGCPACKLREVHAETETLKAPE